MQTQPAARSSDRTVRSMQTKRFRGDRSPGMLGKRPTMWHHNDQSTVTIPRPTSLRDNTPGFRALVFGLLLLAVCVFAWGLKYKLSLYDPPHAVSHHMAAAKLLTGRERSAFSLAGARLPANSAVPPLLSALVLAFPALAATKSCFGFGGWMGRSSPLRIVPACIRSGNSFVRPPPRIL